MNNIKKKVKGKYYCQGCIFADLNRGINYVKICVGMKRDKIKKEETLLLVIVHVLSSRKVTVFHKKKENHTLY